MRKSICSDANCKQVRWILHPSDNKLARRVSQVRGLSQEPPSRCSRCLLIPTNHSGETAISSQLFAILMKYDLMGNACAATIIRTHTQTDTITLSLQFGDQV